MRTMVNEARYGHQSATTAFNRPARVAGPMYTFNTWTNPILTNFAQGRNSPVNEYTDNLTKIYGNHTLKVGGNSPLHYAVGHERRRYLSEREPEHGIRRQYAAHQR